MGGATFSLFCPEFCVYQHKARVLDFFTPLSRLCGGRKSGPPRAQLFLLHPRSASLIGDKPRPKADKTFFCAGSALRQSANKESMLSSSVQFSIWPLGARRLYLLPSNAPMLCPSSFLRYFCLLWNAIRDTITMAVLFLDSVRFCTIQCRRGVCARSSIKLINRSTAY